MELVPIEVEAYFDRIELYATLNIEHGIFELWFWFWLWRAFKEDFEKPKLTETQPYLEELWGDILQFDSTNDLQVPTFYSNFSTQLFEKPEIWSKSGQVWAESRFGPKLRELFDTEMNFFRVFGRTYITSLTPLILGLVGFACLHFLAFL